MRSDTMEALRRFEAELLQERAQPEPAFDDPDQIGEAEDALLYRNFANQYGRLPRKSKRPRKSKGVLGLMVTACVLCVGIIGILLYWLEVYL